MVGKPARAGLFGLAVLVAPSLVQAHSAGELLHDCTDSHGSSARIACLSYLHGLMDGLLAANILSTEGAVFRYCPPRGELSVDELRLIFLKRVEDREDLLDTDAGVFLAGALMDSFACPTEK